MLMVLLFILFYVLLVLPSIMLLVLLSLLLLPLLLFMCCCYCVNKLIVGLNHSLNFWASREVAFKVHWNWSWNFLPFSGICARQKITATPFLKHEKSCWKEFLEESVSLFHGHYSNQMATFLNFLLLFCSLNLIKICLRLNKNGLKNSVLFALCIVSSKIGGKESLKLFFPIVYSICSWSVTCAQRGGKNELTFKA